MPDPNLTYEDLLQIVELIKSSSRFDEFHLKLGDIEVDLKRGGASVPQAAPVAAPAAYPEGAIVVKSPMVGTFYRAPEPGARPFVEVGQQVETDTVVCIIEVIKLMNSIRAGARGVVTHILVEDGGPVEFGQVLMVVESS